jgi:hypothetical protein
MTLEAGHFPRGTIVACKGTTVYMLENDGDVSGCYRPSATSPSASLALVASRYFPVLYLPSTLPTHCRLTPAVLLSERRESLLY